ncbi:MAG TPA: hypothetical protein VFZ72_02260 [Jiangellaceae bacterium]
MSHEPARIPTHVTGLHMVRGARGAPEFTVPWLTIGLTGLAVPLLAVLVAVVFTPSGLPVIRRTT